jgi:hypothetical protein
MLLKGNAVLILGKPFIGGLQPRVQPTGDLNVASAAVDFIEVALEPELVAEIRTHRCTAPRALPHPLAGRPPPMGPPPRRQGLDGYR